jgi:predicted RND superfamily exporter protein
MKIAQTIIKFKWLIITIVVVLLSSALWLLPQLTTNIDFSNFFPQRDKEVLHYKSITKKLGSNDHFLAVAIIPEYNVFNHPFLKQVDQFTMASAKINNIETATSITNLSRYVKSPFGTVTLPYIHLDQEEKLQSDSSVIFTNFEFTQQYISRDASSLLVILKLEEGLGMAALDSIVTQVENLVGNYDFFETHTMGKKLVEVHYKRLMNSELSTSIVGSLGLIILFLLLFYRSLKETILPLLTMIITLLIFYGLLALTDRSLGIMSSLYPTIILIVGISDSIHILTKFNLEINNGLSSKEAILKVINEVGLSILLTSLTTVVGFLTLTTSVMPALRNFGIDASIGIVIALLVSVFLLPAILLILPVSKNVKKQLYSFNWNRIATWIYQIVTKKKQWVLGVTAVCILISCFGIYKIDTNNLQMANIPDSHTLKKDYAYFDQHLGGARTFELVIELKDSSMVNQEENLKDLRRLHDYIHSIPSVQYLVSPITYYHGISNVYAQNLAPLEIPFSESQLNSYEKRLKKYSKDRNWKLVDDNRKFGRFTARIPDLGRHEVKKLNNKIKRWIDQEMDSSRMDFRFAGMDLLIDHGHEHRINNMIWGILLALLAICILIGFLFRQFSMVLITLITNIIPLILIAGLMGIFGIELRGTTSIIFAVGFVIAVDDTIHFMSKYRIERKKGYTVDQAIKTTLFETSKAIFTTSVILFGGFFVLLHSAFGDVYSVGFMVSFMILFALILDLFLVPVLLLLLNKPKIKDD